ncbi:class I SAM-dependent methyltransferase [Pseudomonas sp. ABC1]|uniref:class I SAM-dependent methyltransferase n=1 Tax=Pseudomonas sp. ABC1 TaxID=2748080 RepID=UPI0015C3FECA|nr:class I SAM-dependent methyltransferase [Pseudomonas sp. ABC1]QLF93011.1 class I SAM-dependent methyltransferase [Pseudomonas sp. ABC1]
MSDSRQRFTNRVQDYVKFRPSYPASLVDFLHANGVGRQASVIDIGAGTGIASKLLLDAGHPLTAVEPNDAMRAAAQDWLSGYPGYASIAGSAEQSGLPNACADLVIAAQAFHWFDPDGCRREFKRLLRSGGQVALFWNSRRLRGTAFLEGYEALLRQHGTDYTDVAERYPDARQVAEWFQGGLQAQTCIDNSQRLDYESLKGRLLSSSYAPRADHPGYPAMLAALEKLFDATQRDGHIDFDYDTEVYLGRLP